MRLATTTLPDLAAEGGDDVARALGQVSPGEAQDGPPEADEGILALPVVLEAVHVAVVGPAVDLDCEAVLAQRDIQHCDKLAGHPQGVVRNPSLDAGPAQPAVEFRLGQPCPLERPVRQPVGVAAGQPAQVIEDGPGPGGDRQPAVQCQGADGGKDSVQSSPGRPGHPPRVGHDHLDAGRPLLVYSPQLRRGAEPEHAPRGEDRSPQPRAVGQRGPAHQEHAACRDLEFAPRDHPCDGFLGQAVGAQLGARNDPVLLARLRSPHGSHRRTAPRRFRPVVHTPSIRECWVRLATRTLPDMGVESWHSPR